MEQFEGYFSRIGKSASKFLIPGTIGSYKPQTQAEKKKISIEKIIRKTEAETKEWKESLTVVLEKPSCAFTSVSRV
jgi:hypothetical protein